MKKIIFFSLIVSLLSFFYIFDTLTTYFIVYENLGEEVNPVNKLIPKELWIPARLFLLAAGIWMITKTRERKRLFYPLIATTLWYGGVFVWTVIQLLRL